MASTAEGKRLTRAQQAAQVAIGNMAAAEARLLWPRLDVSDLDGSLPYWLATSVVAANRRMQESQRIAAAYMVAFREAEIGGTGPIVFAAPKGTPDALRVAGPVRIKQLILSGLAPAEAYERAFTKYEGMVRRQAMMGGRLTIAASAGRDRKALGWRRVTDGKPCAFCAMLASRGPVYRSAASADGLQYHAHCGCTAEPAYTTWKPSEAEEQYVDEYAYAAARVRDAGDRETTKAILSEMRKSGLFRDSH